VIVAWAQRSDVAPAGGLLPPWAIYRSIRPIEYAR
jgi:hypothetical protein